MALKRAKIGNARHRKEVKKLFSNIKKHIKKFGLGKKIQDETIRATVRTALKQVRLLNREKASQAQKAKAYTAVRTANINLAKILT